MIIQNKCLTCGKEERMVGKLPYKYYGFWVHCNCPRYWDPPWWGKPNLSLANNGIKERKLHMFIYGVLARTLLQEADEADKKGPIYGVLSFEIQSTDWTSAVDAAVELLPDTYSIFSVQEVGPIEAV